MNSPRGRRSAIVLAIAFIAGCGGKQHGDESKANAAPSAAATSSAGHATNAPPELLLPAWTTAGIGQRVTFGLNVVDHELDTVMVSLIDKPASAIYDPITLTVDWTPTAADAPMGTFTARVTERDRLFGVERSVDHAFSIAISDGPAPAPAARSLGPVVETLITIHDEARLAAVNEQWPFTKMLAHSATLFIGAMDESARSTIATPTGAEMFDSFLTSLAELHGNPRLDPRSPSFDRESFGDPGSWKIITVRPRLDKKWQELRVVYWASKAAEPVFAMFRLRPVHTNDLSDDAQAFNNHEFSRLVFEALFDAAGTLRPAFAEDPIAHGDAVAKLVTDVVTYADAAKPYASATFIALATEARMGGGSARDSAGGYASGDGWAWSAMKPLPTPDGTAVAYTNIPIKGFWTAAKPTADNTAWTAACAPRFDPHDADHAPGYDVLCRPEGLVDLPAVRNGVVVSSKKEASNLFLDHKLEDSVAQLALRDARRDLGEEAGMTCAQCHMRNFGVRDRSDPLPMDPRALVPPAMNPQLATTFFVIVPTNRWSQYMLEFQKDQECKASAAFEQFLGETTSLSCPLDPPLEPGDESEAELEARVVAEFEAAVLNSRDAYLNLFDFVAVGRFQILLRRHDLYGRWPNIPARYKANIELDTGAPYPPERERRNVGAMYRRIAQRAVGTGGCSAGEPVDEWVGKMDEPFEPLGPDNDAYIPLANAINPLIEAGGVVRVMCTGGGHQASLLYTRTNTERGYTLIAITNDPLLE